MQTLQLEGTCRLAFAYYTCTCLPTLDHLIDHLYISCVTLSQQSADSQFQHGLDSCSVGIRSVSVTVAAAASQHSAQRAATGWSTSGAGSLCPSLQPQSGKVCMAMLPCQVHSKTLHLHAYLMHCSTLSRGVTYLYRRWCLRITNLCSFLDP